MLFALEEEFLFTLHFATINTTEKGQVRAFLINLHYTLLLLIRSKNYLYPLDTGTFTLHFATINTLNPLF